MGKKIYCWQQMQLHSLKGEQWKDIPGYKKIYQVSNYGRVRSLSRRIEPQMGLSTKAFSYVTSEKILRQKIVRKFNKTANIEYKECVVTLRKDGQAKVHMVSRLVYHAFVRPLNFQKDHLFVTHKNNDTQDNFYRNLVAISRSEAVNKAYTLKRMTSPFTDMSKQKKKAIRKKVAEGQCKAVQRISASGKVIKNYPSIKAASIELNIAAPNITGVLKGRINSARGTYWQYKK